MRSWTVAVVVLGSCFAHAGCSTVPSQGDRMLDHSEQSRSQGLAWQHGQKLVKRGETDRERAHKRLASARESLKDAEERIKEGQQLMKLSEDSFVRNPKPQLR